MIQYPLGKDSSVESILNRTIHQGSKQDDSMTYNTLEQAVYPIITLSKIGVHIYENEQCLHVCFREFVGSFKGRTIVDLNESQWKIKSAVEIECLTPFWIRLFRAPVVRMQLETEVLPAIPFDELRKQIVADLKKGGWAFNMAGLICEFTAADSRKIVGKISQANNVQEVVSILTNQNK